MIKTCSVLFRPSEYLKPNKMKEACSLIAKYGKKGCIIAGATDVFVDKPKNIDALIDITGLNLNYIKRDKRGIRIGALTTQQTLETSKEIRKDPWAVISETAYQMGTPGIRNVATIGGNICKAQPSADLPPPLIALDAEVKLAGRRGERSILLERFITGVEKTALRTGEFLKEIWIPNPPPHTGAVFLKMGRSRIDLAVINTAVRVTLGSGEVCRDVKIVLGTAASIPFRPKKTEGLVRGKKLNDALIGEAGQIASKEAKPRTTLRSTEDYRRQIIAVFVKRGLKEAFERAKKV